MPILTIDIGLIASSELVKADFDDRNRNTWIEDLPILANRAIAISIVLLHTTLIARNSSRITGLTS